MIKYVEYESFDEHGLHIIPVNSLYDMNKTASAYSPELMKIILGMKRREDRYYVVVNALGSYEVWGCNRNGDGFPEDGLTHKSLRTDMGTPNDYGYKTFEYYARVYKHHVNKDPKRSFGEIIFAHWNPVLHRIELIVAINRVTGKDIIDALEAGNLIAVSMGAKVRYDECNICGNHARTRLEYCFHLKNHLRQIIDRALAERWSKEVGRIILPGTQVHAINDYPRFFDLSKVYIGADRTSYILGKAASSGLVVCSADIAEAMGVTDDMVDKMAQVGKQSEINKNVGGGISPDDIDGTVAKANKVQVIRKAIDERMNDAIVAEPMLPAPLLDSMASAVPASSILSTMLGMGIHPKPLEFQRIILVRVGQKPLADELENRNMVFDYDDDTVEPQALNVSNQGFNDTLGKLLAPHLQSRSCFPSFLSPRVQAILVKKAAHKWLSPEQDASYEKTKISPALKILGGLAALYAGLKLKAAGYGPKQLAEIFANRPWLRIMIGGGVLAKIYSEIGKKRTPDPILRPASEYENVLQDTRFSGHLTKESSTQTVANVLGSAGLAGAILYPSAYILKAYNQKSLRRRGRPLFPGAGQTPAQIATLGGAAAGAGALLKEGVVPKITKALKSIR